jgi:hypothetical protein
MFKLSLAALWPLLMAKPELPQAHAEPESLEPWNHEEEIFRLNHAQHLEWKQEQRLLMSSNASDLKRLVL